jgi:glycosyltransferase involved in cell wall biosynthesis
MSNTDIDAFSKTPPRLSVVVPAYNEAENVENLATEISVALSDIAYEMIFIDDASTDETKSVLMDMKSRFPHLRVLSHRQNSGQSRGVRSGVKAARAPVIATLDSDGQNDPADIPMLFAQITRDGAPENLAMVGGRRAKRIDSTAKKIGSRFGNGVRKRLLKDNADDTGCGLKLFRKDAFLDLPYFDHIHRYIPALMLREGYKIEFADVNHRAREFGVSKYTNFGRLKVSIADLRGVIWLRRRMKLPGGVDEL